MLFEREPLLDLSLNLEFRDVFFQAVFSHDGKDLSYALFDYLLCSDVPVLVGSSVVDFDAYSPKSLSKVYSFLDELFLQKTRELFENVQLIDGYSRDARFEIFLSHVSDYFKFSYQSVCMSDSNFLKRFFDAKHATQYCLLDPTKPDALRVALALAHRRFSELLRQRLVCGFVNADIYLQFNVIATFRAHGRAVLLK